MSEDDILLQNEVAQSLGMPLTPQISVDDFPEKLVDFINYLIRKDFQKLVYILYKVDVSEVKLKQMLQQNSDEDAAQIIAALIVERQIQKIESRKKINGSNNISGEEKW